MELSSSLQYVRPPQERVLWRHEVAAMDLNYTWELKLRLSERLHVPSPFALRMLQGAVELDDTRRLRAYVHSGLLEVDVLTQTCRTCTRREEARIGAMAGLQQAARLWSFLARGIQVPHVLRVRRQRVSPLVLAINSPYLEEETGDSPGNIETLLLGNCDPNEFGCPEVSPMTAALRIMDTKALVSLLTANANPNRTPRGDHLPIFVAISRQNVSAVRALVEARANLQVRSFGMAPTHTRGVRNGPSWVGYTPLEMAGGNAAITRALLHTDEEELPEQPWDWERWQIQHTGACQQSTFGGALIPIQGMERLIWGSDFHSTLDTSWWQLGLLQCHAARKEHGVPDMFTA